MVFKVKTWNHILIEGFCMINVDHLAKSSKYIYGWEGNKDPEARGKLPNPNYDPDSKPDEKPEYCKTYVCEACIQGSKLCEHLAWSGVEKKLKKKFKKLVKKEYSS